MAATFPMPADYSDVAKEASPPRPVLRAPPSQYSPFARENTTYAGQNLWMQSKGRNMESGLPVTLSDGHWQETRNAQSPRRSHSQLGHNSSNEYFEQYMKLMNRMAYRYPNPGPPRYRSGNVGSNWRHIRQVLGYGGSNICFIDGVVKQYDLNNFNQELATRRPHHMGERATPLYAVNKHDISGFRNHLNLQTEKENYKPWQPTLPPITDRPGYYH